MKTIYNAYSSPRKKIKSKEDTVAKWDTLNGTKWEPKIEKNEISLTEVAKENYNENLDFEFCQIDDDSDFPQVYVQITPENKHIAVNFIDGAGREYLNYNWRETEIEGNLFLEEIWFYEFANEDTDTMKSRTYFVFNQKGNVSYRVYDMIQNKTMDFESKEPLDVSGLYEQYPEFGEYEGIIKLERDIPMLNDVMS